MVFGQRVKLKLILKTLPVLEKADTKKIVSGEPFTTCTIKELLNSIPAELILLN
jgi:hypothetical protein